MGRHGTEKREEAIARFTAGQPYAEIAAALGVSPNTVRCWVFRRKYAVGPVEAPGPLHEETQQHAREAAERVWASIEREEHQIVEQIGENVLLIAQKINARVQAGKERTAGAKGGEQDVSLRDLVGALEYSVKNWQLLKGGPTARTEAKAEVTSRGVPDDPEYRDLLKRLYRARSRIAGEPEGPGG